MINVEPVRWKVEIFAVYQLIAAEFAVRGRLQHGLNDPDPYVTLHNVVTTPLLPGVPRLPAIAEGYFSKLNFGAVRTVEPEAAPPDQAQEIVRRLVYFQGANFTVHGAIEFPAAADPKLHREMLLKAKFFPVFDASLTPVGVELAPLQWPHCYVNRDLMVGLYLG